MKKILLALLLVPQLSQAQMAIQSYADNKVLIGVNDNLLKNGGISRELVNQNRSVTNWNLVQGTISGSILFKTDSGNMPLKKLVLHLEGGKELTIEDESGSLTLTMAKIIPVNFSVVHPNQGFKTEIMGSERITVSAVNSGVFSGMRISGGMFCDVQGVCFNRSQTVSIMNYLQQILPSGIAVSNLSMEKYAQTSDSLITVANIMQKGAGTLQITLGADILNLALSGGDNKVFEKQFLSTPIYVQKGTGSLVPSYVLP